MSHICYDVRTALERSSTFHQSKKLILHAFDKLSSKMKCAKHNVLTVSIHHMQSTRPLPTCSCSPARLQADNGKPHFKGTTFILHAGLTHQRWAANRTRLAWRTLLLLHAGAAPAPFLRGLLFSSSTPPEHPARTPSSRAGRACRRRQGSTCSGPRLCAAARAGCASGRGWWCRTSGTCNVPQSLHSAPRCR